MADKRVQARLYSAPDPRRWRSLGRRQCGVTPIGSMSRSAPPQAVANQAIGHRSPLPAGAFGLRKLRATGQRRISPATIPPKFR